LLPYSEQKSRAPGLLFSTAYCADRIYLNIDALQTFGVRVKTPRDFSKAQRVFTLTPIISAGEYIGKLS
jgi:hypothetical protein